MVDLETLLDDSKAGHGAVDSDWNDYDYFLCVKKDGRIEDPFAEPHQQVFDDGDPDRDYESQDSDDSNRESADANDYPEEEERDYGREYGGYGTSDDEYGDQRRKKKRRHSDSDMDEEEAARRYNQRHQRQGGLASWLDRIQRKSKAGATQSHTLHEMLANNQNISSDDENDMAVEVMGPDMDSDQEEKYRMDLDDDETNF